jgi:UDP-glucose 6-dehydrogenase
MKIAISSADYIVLPNAILLAQHNHMVADEIVPEKGYLLSLKTSFIEDSEIEACDSLKEDAAWTASIAKSRAIFVAGH